ncbi:MAG TPA: LPXTG cell wall anchor domain-containing protein [Thermoanaerobaculia bacterium]|nr:LPXTG cell wall anchor domain-containing protein [Thermoanaerobaculia bacterium]
MKRFVFLTLVLVLALTGAAWAQSPTTSAPTGSSLQREPQPANNDLRNPGNPQDQAGKPSTTTTTDTTGTTSTTPSTTTTTTTTTDTPSTTGSSTDTTSTSTTTDTTGTSGTSTSTSGSLPRTGSEMPLVGIIGLLALASAVGFRVYAKRNV